ncbi:MAG: hypothetical protein AAB631_00910 [Patescibacteria group bacterium]
MPPPFGGSAVARIFPQKHLKEFHPEHETVQKLKKQGAINKNVVSIFGVFDNHVWPVESCRLDGAKNIQVNSFGHHKILFDKKVKEIVLSEVEKYKSVMANKTYVLRFRAINRDIFWRLKVERIETRAATLRYRHVKVGDGVKLICGKSTFQKKVKRIKTFRTIPAMLKVYRVKEINPNTSSAKELKELYLSFPGYKEKIKKFGLIALELK